MPNTLEQKVVNISGTKSDNLVSFHTPEEYLFENTDKGDQGGIWNRNIVSVRIENVEPWQIEDMDYYFRKLYRKNRLEHRAKFSIIFSPLYNFVRWLCSFSDIAVRGNCAFYTSSVSDSYWRHGISLSRRGLVREASCCRLCGRRRFGCVLAWNGWKS